MEGRHTPIVGLSGNARNEYIQKAIVTGMDDYIVKPYQKDDLYSKVAKFEKPKQPDPNARPS